MTKFQKQICDRYCNTGSYQRIIQKLKLFFAFLCLVHVTSYAQNPTYVNDLSFQTDETNRLLLPDDTGFDDLHPHDIPMLEVRQVSKLERKTLDENDNPQTEIEVIGAVNAYEDWEGLAEKWLINQDGMLSFKRVAKSGKETWEDLNFIPIAKHEADYYNSLKQQILNKGYLASKAFPKDIKTHLLQSGTDFIDKGNIIQVSSDEQFVLFDLSNTPSITTITYDHAKGPVVANQPDVNDPDVVRVSISTFGIDIKGESLLSSTIEFEKVVLFNGLCAKKVREKYYSNYQIAQSGISGRSSKATSRQGQVSISPNPLNSNVLFVQVPQDIMGQEANIQVMSMDGRLIQNIKTTVEGEKLSLRIGEHLDSNGLYLLRITSEAFNATKQFYFLNY